MLDTQTDSDAPNKNSSSVATPDTRKDSGTKNIMKLDVANNIKMLNSKRLILIEIS
jgi:hypothetical protein